MGGEENRLCVGQGVRRIGCVWAREERRISCVWAREGRRISCVWARGGGEYPVCGTTVV